MSEIFVNKTVKGVLSEYNCTLGLDISKTSTGVALYQNGILKLYRICLENGYNKDDTLWESKMKKEFKENLTSIIKGKEFDLVVIENTINGCNAITNKELVLLNTVFDDLVSDGVCKVDSKKLIRPFPNVWRKALKDLAGSVTANNTKVLVEKLLHRLGFMYVLEHSEESENKKKTSGFYDICDATGMLIAYMYKNSSLNKKS